MSIEKGLLRTGVSAIGVKLSAAALSYAMFVVLARWLGPETYGRYASVFSAGTFLSFVMLAGLHTEALRRLPALDRAAAAGGERRAFLGGALRALALSSLAVALAGLLAAGGAAALGLGGWGGMILLALALGAAMALAEFLASVFRGLGAVNVALVPRDVLWRLLVLGAVTALAALKVAGGLVSAVLLTGLLLLAALAAQALAGRRLLPAAGAPPAPRPAARALLWNARWLAAAALASNLLQPLAVVAVGVGLSYAEGGVFFAAQKTAALLSLPLIAMNMIGAPRIARAWAAGDRAEVQRLCTQIAVTATAGTALGLVVVLALSGQLLAVFNPAYRSEGTILILLSLGNLVNTLAGPTGYLMLMTGHEKRFVLISALAQITGVLTVLTGGALFGLPGAACGEVIAVAIFNLVIWRWCWRTLGIESSFFSLFRR